MKNNVKKILICEDSITARKKLKECISEKGDFEIIEASDGELSVELYKLTMPDLVFMDIVMPKMDGTLAAKEIKAFDSNATIVMLSSSGTKENLKKTLDYGVKDFIQKPWNDVQIGNILDKLVLKGE